MLNKQGDQELEIAELLVCAGFVNPYDLDRAHASTRGGPGIRDVLIELNATDINMWAAAIAVLQQIRSARLPKEEARNALHMVGNCGMPINEAMEKMGYKAAPKSPWGDSLEQLKTSGKYGAVQ